VEGYKDWVDRTREAHVIESVNDTLQYYYAVIELPALKDRDLVAQLKIHQDRATRVVTDRSRRGAGQVPVPTAGLSASPTLPTLGPSLRCAAATCGWNTAAWCPTTGPTPWQNLRVERSAPDPRQPAGTGAPKAQKEPARSLYRRAGMSVFFPKNITQKIFKTLASYAVFFAPL
jgi:hypothetical protein